MHREYIKWWSPNLGREMEMLVFGHAGTPVLVFPSSMGRFHEWEDFKMVEACRYQLENGYNQFFCVDSVDGESFYNRHADPYTRMMRHRQYDAYIRDEVIPFMRDRAMNGRVVATGASFGAYHALNVTLKYPGQFVKLIAMSGKYDIRNFMDGFYDDNVYFNNPVDYLPGLNDHNFLERIRSVDIRLVAGDADICLEAGKHFSGILFNKGIPHQMDVWGHGVVHDWPEWRNMLQKHLPQ
jgi:esterase/lipase superfamily enzyme